MGVSPNDTGSQQRNPERVSKDQRGSAELVRFGYKQIIPVLAAGAAAVAIAAAPTAMAEPAAVQQPPGPWGPPPPFPPPVPWGW